MGLGHESLERKPGGPDNWIEAVKGQLPAYIQHIAKDLHEERGMPLSRAIAVAISRCKLWAAGGGGVKPDTRAKAAKAIAEWEALKAKNKARQTVDVAKDAPDSSQVYVEAPISVPEKRRKKRPKVLLTKKDFTPGERRTAAKKGNALPDGSYPINNIEDLKNAIQAIGRAKDPVKAKAHIKTRARALGRTDLLPKDWL